MSTIPSSRQRSFLAGLTFSLFLIFGYFSDLILLRHTGWIIADDLIIAVAAAIVVFLYERERSRILAERVRVIRDMNSFVRNELQVLYACLDNAEKTRVSTAERSVERIDWALRELLPGKERLDHPLVDVIDEHPTGKIKRSA